MVHTLTAVGVSPAFVILVDDLSPLVCDEALLCGDDVGSTWFPASASGAIKVDEDSPLVCDDALACGDDVGVTWSASGVNTLSGSAA